MDITPTENSIKTRLDVKLAPEISAGDFEAEVYPDDVGGARRPLKKKGRFSICYLDTTADPPKTTDVTSQEVYNNFGVFLAARTRLGPTGINEMIRLTIKWLLGYSPLGHERLTLKKVDLFEREKDTNQWLARVELVARSRIVEFNDDPEPVNINQMTFNPPAYGGESTVVTADTVIPNEPPEG